MRGVILGRTDARLVDVAHDFPRQNVRASAFWLREVLPYVPPAVHLAVVDPGVGTDRDALVIRAGDHALVCPDNGLGLPAARELGDPEVFVLEYEDGAGEWLADPASSTFHGRDVFAPAAARVHESGVDAVERIAGVTSAQDFTDLVFPEPEFGVDGATGTVLAVDGFGNAITNVPGRVLDDRFGDHVEANGVRAPVERTYASVEPGRRLVTVGSHGNVELAVNRGRGEDAFDVGVDSRVELILSDTNTESTDSVTWG
jgi:S-adenosylmethionine hydrolase